MNPGGLAAQEPAAVQPTSEAPAPLPEVPHLADLIPRATALAGRLAQLETTLKTSSDPSDLQNQLLEIDSSLKKYAAELQKLKSQVNRRWWSADETAIGNDQHGRGAQRDPPVRDRTIENTGGCQARVGEGTGAVEDLAGGVADRRASY